MASLQLPIHCREIEALNKQSSDYAFITNAWLRNYRHSAFAGKIPSEIYFSCHEQLISNVLAGSNLIFASNPEDLNQHFGFLVYEKRDEAFITHFVYVKKVFKRLGIATEMFAKAGLVPNVAHLATHRTTDFEIFARTLNSPFVYHPYFLLQEYF